MTAIRRIDREEHPPGWSRERVEAIVRYHESRTDEEAAAEVESAEEAGDWVMVPRELVGEVRALIKKHEARKAS